MEHFDPTEPIKKPTPAELRRADEIKKAKERECKQWCDKRDAEKKRTRVQMSKEEKAEYMRQLRMEQRRAFLKREAKRVRDLWRKRDSTVV